MALSDKVGLFVAIFLIVGAIILSIMKKPCKPTCSGAFCGPNSSNGCGGTCDCNSGGKCQENGVCCYSDCDGIHWGDDGCGGTCECTIIPGGKKLTKGTEKVCCYAQHCNNVYCGPDGCGGSCSCQAGSVCSDPTNGGICQNEGTNGYIYNIIDSNGVARTNVNSPKECASWMPKNVALNLTAFPCETDADCPYKDSCVKDHSSDKKFCNRNDVYQWWYYDPSDSSGFNCTKIRQGSTVCSLPKAGAHAFDIAGNLGADKVKCSDTCTISPLCPPSGKGACCPGQWSQKSANSSHCINTTGQTECCLQSPDVVDYQACLNTGKPSCDKTPSAWWEGNLGEIANDVCGMKVVGPSIHVNKGTISNPSFTEPCNNKNPGDSCNYNSNGTSYQGLCKSCSDNSIKCLPDVMCTRQYKSASQPGMCTTKNVCMF
jgi:hypothetical protein